VAHPIETYLEEVAAIHSSNAAVGELPYYGALSRLLSEVGAKLDPHVRCLMNLRDLGAGFPDGGLFTPDQFEAGGDLPGVRPRGKPARGAIEAKAADHDVWTTVVSEQVRRYAAEYGRVLVTNYREFVLVVPGQDGAPVALEAFSFADDEAAFWQAAAHPRTAARRIGEDAVAYLGRVLSADARITEPRDVAAILAQYARVARSRIERDAHLPGLDDFRATMTYALGAKFTGERGERFLRSAVVQSLFYAVFSAWVLWTRERRTGTSARFNWREAAWFTRLPLLEATSDVHMNGVAAWRNVPDRVWTYTLGGYPVLKKWLSYRETALLGRKLLPDEASHFTDTARRIAVVLLMAGELNDNYRAVARDARPFTPDNTGRAQKKALAGETGALL